VNSAHNRERLYADLVHLGVKSDTTLLAHASMRAIRPDAGGAATVVGALLDAVGERGTLVVPAQTTWNSVTSRQYRLATAGLNRREAAAYRARLPAFDPARTPSHGMGALAEYVRTMPGAWRSTHPQCSFAAVGARARELMAVHDLECHLGERSPLAALCAAGAQVLHLGTGYEVSTVFHLAEYRYASLPRRGYKCRTLDGWTRFKDIELDDGDFGAIGAEFEAESRFLHRSAVGAAQGLLFPAEEAVQYAVAWMRRNRQAETHRSPLLRLFGALQTSYTGVGRPGHRVPADDKVAGSRGPTVPGGPVSPAQGRGARRVS
jgi:aminoglycoside 3-N-acetyltransferase